VQELSPRELEIAKEYAGGATYHTIASQLCLAPSTVRTHLATIYRKLEVSSKLELLARLDGSDSTPRNQTDMGAIISELALSLEEAISRERALSEVLRIISGSHGDVATVMPAILGYALELCDAEFGILFDYSEDAKFRASYTLGIPKAFQTWLSAEGAFSVKPETGLGRVESQREVVNIMDVRAEAIFNTDKTLRYATAIPGGHRQLIAIPMLAGDRLVGASTIDRQQVRPFNETTTRLAQTFAEQSVIALENARLLSALRSADTGAHRHPNTWGQG